jgi:putative transposase
VSKKKHLAQDVIDMIIPIRRRMPCIGTRKLYHLLRERLDPMGIGRDKLFSIMRANHLHIHPQRSYRVTTNSYHRFRKHPDLVNGTEIIRPEQVWVSDITYLGTRNSHTYLSLITDAYSKKIVGFDLSDSLNIEGVLKALKVAVKSRSYPDQPLIHHSDRGAQYCSNEYQNLLAMHKIKCSMTTSSDPYANAVAERVNGIIKNEFKLENYKVDLPVLKKVIAQSILIYNTERPHLSCSFLTPHQMHSQNQMSIKTYKTRNGCKDIPATV